MITYQVESFKDNLEELKLLFHDHYNEIGHNVDRVELNPDYEQFLIMEELNMLHLVTVRDDSQIIGYYLSVISPLLHFKHIKNAYNDAIYLVPKYRKGIIAYRMLQFAEKELIKVGVKRITIHMKVDYPFDSLCEKLGMTYIERHYMKEIGD